MARLINNSFQMPNLYVDKVIPLLKDGESKCLVYMCRKIFGWGKDKRTDQISISQFTDGQKNKKGEHINYGCGVTSPITVKKSLESLVKFGIAIMVKKGDYRTATEWGLQLDESKIRMDLLLERKEKKQQKAQGTADNFVASGSKNDPPKSGSKNDPLSGSKNDHTETQYKPNINIPDKSGDSSEPDSPKKTQRKKLTPEEQSIRSEMRSAYCYMVYGHSDTGSLSKKETMAINAEISRIRKHERGYTVEHMRYWWGNIWSKNWRNKNKKPKDFERVQLSDIRNGMAAAWEEMNGNNVPSVLSSGKGKPMGTTEQAMAMLDEETIRLLLGDRYVH